MECCNARLDVLDPNEDKNWVKDRDELKSIIKELGVGDWECAYQCIRCGQYWWQEYFATGHGESYRFRKITKDELREKFPDIQTD